MGGWRTTKLTTLERARGRVSHYDIHKTHGAQQESMLRAPTAYICASVQRSSWICDLSALASRGMGSTVDERARLHLEREVRSLQGEN